MKQRKVLLFVSVLLFSLAFSPAGCSRPGRTPAPRTPSPSLADPFARNKRLGRGVNLGNALEAPREGEWGVTLKEEHFQLIKDGGFDSVRVPIRWSAHASKTAPYTIDPAFFARVDWAVEQALARGLMVVINVHHYEEIMQRPAAHRERFLALWAQIAAHYKGYPPDLLFELLNEPNSALTARTWNPLLQDALGTIRQTNPERNVVVGPADWNSIGSLASLELPPDDKRIIVTVHYYDPFHFTHQGAEWVSGSSAWLGTDWQGTAAQEQAVRRGLDRAAAWAQAHDRPLYLGEFGAYSKAGMDSRARWTAFVARQAEERGLSWAYWEFCAGFGVYDQALRRWNEPLLAALIPQPG